MGGQSTIDGVGYPRRLQDSSGDTSDGPQGVLHSDGRFWKAPERFSPSRWERDVNRPEYAYLPFNGVPPTLYRDALRPTRTGDGLGDYGRTGRTGRHGAGVPDVRSLALALALDRRGGDRTKAPEPHRTNALRSRQAAADSHVR